MFFNWCGCHGRPLRHFCIVADTRILVQQKGITEIVADGIEWCWMQILYEVESTMSTTVQKQYAQEGYEQETDAWNTIQHSVCCRTSIDITEMITRLVIYANCIQVKVYNIVYVHII